MVCHTSCSLVWHGIYHNNIMSLSVLYIREQCITSHHIHIFIYPAFLVEQVTSGTVKVTLSYGSVPLVDETLDLCDLVTQIHKQCPLQTGPFTLQLKENIPDYVPSVSELFIVNLLMSSAILTHVYTCRVPMKAKPLFLIRMEKKWRAWILTCNYNSREKQHIIITYIIIHTYIYVCTYNYISLFTSVQRCKIPVVLSFTRKNII